LAAIPLILAGFPGAFEQMTGGDTESTTTTTTTATDATTPGLDFGTGTMFDKIATRYDTINRVLAMNMDIGWRRQMTKRIQEILMATATDNDNDIDIDNNNGNDEQQRTPWRILDVATGTADVALQLIADLAPSHPTTVLGLDPSENMLAVGRSKIATQNLQSKIVLETADARDLQHYHETTTNIAQRFDAATIAFGIRNVVPHRSRALCEIHKLLKPNKGVLAILEFSDPTYERDGILGAAAGVFIRNVVPVVGGLLSGGARKEYLHLQNSIKEFPAPDDFKQQLQDLECPLREEDGDDYSGEDDMLVVGHYDVENVVHMNFGSVQLYIGRASVKIIAPKQQKPTTPDTKLPPIGM
jgi:demethylmenaquinone methyltransferase/2-methoxy-6-polyprenyl-1,4-benzoquinol methylase